MQLVTVHPAGAGKSVRFCFHLPVAQDWQCAGRNTAITPDFTSLPNCSQDQNVILTFCFFRAISTPESQESAPAALADQMEFFFRSCVEAVQACCVCVIPQHRRNTPPLTLCAVQPDISGRRPGTTGARNSFAFYQYENQSDILTVWF